MIYFIYIAVILPRLGRQLISRAKTIASGGVTLREPVMLLVSVFTYPFVLSFITSLFGNFTTP